MAAWHDHDGILEYTTAKADCQVWFTLRSMYLHVKQRYHISFITRAKVAYKIFDTKSCSQSVNYWTSFRDWEVSPFTSDQWNQDGLLPAPSCAHAQFSRTQAFILRARLEHSADSTHVVATWTAELEMSSNKTDRTPVRAAKEQQQQSQR